MSDRQRLTGKGVSQQSVKGVRERPQRLEQRPGGPVRLEGRREKAMGDGGCSRTTTSLGRAGATGVRAWTQEVGGALMLC